MLEYQEVTLRKATPDDKETLFHLITENQEWTRFNGPYFPYSPPTPDEFQTGLFERLQQGDDTLIIEYNHTPIGTVSYYWEDKRTRWLEVGIVVYSHNQWGKGLGRKALIPWITHLFHTLEIARVGLTTWSGNPRMMVCAEAIGMKLEARLRKVRYYNEHYYDSVKFGVLREEWFKKYPNLSEKVVK
ncbi:GNAT family N-acetyltransferase [Endozoicomonas sp. Mp262]|uniref:GNAT family N-acetyltransferase n=1 Tax=Endozoicomonas sp. Mp262 TaxID=2919499 RepID=UPI0021D946DF